MKIDHVVVTCIVQNIKSQNGFNGLQSHHSGCRLFGVGSSWRQRSRADGAGSDGVLEPLSLQMFAVRYCARFVLTVQCLVLTPALARKRSSSQWLLSVSTLARAGANTRAQAVREATTCLRPATTLLASRLVQLPR